MDLGFVKEHISGGCTQNRGFGKVSRGCYRTDVKLMTNDRRPLLVVRIPIQVEIGAMAGLDELEQAIVRGGQKGIRRALRTYAPKGYVAEVA